MSHPPSVFSTGLASRKVTFELTSPPAEIARARAFVRRQCLAAGFDEDLCHSAMLLTSEVVTNALVHAGLRACVGITVGPAGLLVEIEDDASGFVTQRSRARYPDLQSAGGRGLFILGELATEWGSYTRPGGKVVWFHLAGDRAALPG